MIKLVPTETSTDRSGGFLSNFRQGLNSRIAMCLACLTLTGNAFAKDNKDLSGPIDDSPIALEIKPYNLIGQHILERFFARKHTIEAGDTLSSISQKFYGDTNDPKNLLKFNKGVDPKKLVIGSQILVPLQEGQLDADVVNFRGVDLYYLAKSPKAGDFRDILRDFYKEVSEDLIKKFLSLNPEATNGLKKGQTVILPTSFELREAEQSPKIEQKEKIQPQKRINPKPPSENRQYRIADLVDAIIQVESGGNPNAIGSKGEVGLVQLMPIALEELNRVYGVKIPSKMELLKPETNKAYGELYIRYLLEKFNGDVECAVAAYNAGPTRIKTALSNSGSNYLLDLPKSTQDYVKRVLALKASNSSYYLASR